MSANFLLTFHENGITLRNSRGRNGIGTRNGPPIDKKGVFHMSKTGNLSINSENIFPIIKKWLYSDHDIFVRELVSNGCDAITKLKKLEACLLYTSTGTCQCIIF